MTPIYCLSQIPAVDTDHRPRVVPQRHLSRKSVMMRSKIRISFFANIWTENDAQSTCRIFSGPFSEKMASSPPRNMHFFKGCFRFASLPVITLTSSEHGPLGQLRNHRRIFFKSTWSAGPLLDFCAQHDMEPQHQAVAVYIKSSECSVFSYIHVQKE